MLFDTGLTNLKSLVPVTSMHYDYRKPTVLEARHARGLEATLSETVRTT